MFSVLLQINNLNGYKGTFYIVINLFYITVIVYYSTPLVGNMSVDGLPCQKGRHLYFQSEIELNFHNTSSQIKFCLRLLLSFFLEIIVNLYSRIQIYKGQIDLPRFLSFPWIFGLHSSTKLF